MSKAYGAATIKWRLSVQAKSKHKKYLEDAANGPVNCDLRYQGQVFDSESVSPIG
ncbi:hypothetical protein [Shewanella woodyi]|uniref:hypothetical protein n=1 Tax=Shewanella woodyi TaxID=60961 RepID=UPI00374839B1